MPRFDFQCKKCSRTFEETLPFGSKTLPACPSCGSKRTEKLIAPPGIVFKGSGWYKTESRPAPKKEEMKESEKKTEKLAEKSEKNKQDLPRKSPLPEGEG